MTVLMAILVGVLYACGIYLMLRRNIVKLIFGLMPSWGTPPTC